MPALACWRCGRQIHSTAALESLFAEERRCTRCGAYLNNERRLAERRRLQRRQAPAGDVGSHGEHDRRIADRRQMRRRGDPDAWLPGRVAAGARFG